MAGVRVNVRDLASSMPSFTSFKRGRMGKLRTCLADRNDSERSLPNPGNLESPKTHRLSVGFRL